MPPLFKRVLLLPLCLAIGVATSGCELLYVSSCTARFIFTKKQTNYDQYTLPFATLNVPYQLESSIPELNIILESEEFQKVFRIENIEFREEKLFLYGTPIQSGQYTFESPERAYCTMCGCSFRVTQIKFSIFTEDPIRAKER